MSITPNVPQPGETETFERAATPRWVPLVVVVLFLALAGAVYAGYTSRTRLENEVTAANTRADSRSDQLGKQLDQINERLAQLRGQLDVTSQKLGLTQDELARARTLAQQIQKQQQDSESQLGAQIGQVKQESDAHAAQLGQVSTDLTGAKGDIAATRKDLDDTKARLTTTTGDLGVQSGLIARNREDLESLRRLNERNIFEFNLTRTKAPQHVGPVQITLRSVDAKHFKYTMTVIVDDKPIEKKDRTADEPVQFYVRGSRAPYEIVVFDVTKDRINGYLSTPKDTAQAAAAAPAPGAAPAKAQ